MSKQLPKYQQYYELFKLEYPIWEKGHFMAWLINEHNENNAVEIAQQVEQWLKVREND